MAYKKRRVCIDFGNRTIKILEGMVKKELEVLAFESVEVSPHTYENGNILDVDEVAKILSQRLSVMKIKAKSLHLSFNSSEVILRTFDLPTQKTSDIPAILDFELSEKLPILLNDYVMDYQIIKQYKEDEIPYSKVLVGLVPKKIITPFSALAQRLNLAPSVLDLNMHTHERFYFSYIKPIPGIHAFLDIGFDISNVTLYQDGLWAFSKNLDIGVSDIYFKIANAYNIDIDDAEKRLSNLFLSDDGEKSEIQLMLEEAVNDLIAEISRTFRYFTSQDATWRIDKITLLGGAYQLPLVEKILTQEYPVEVMNLKEELFPFLSEKLAQMKDFDLNKYANAIGLLY